MIFHFGKGGDAENARSAWAGEGHRDDLADPAGGRRHDDHPVGEKERFADLVGDIDGCNAVLEPDALELEHHELAGLSVERREGLVEQEDLGTDGERAGEVGALLHAAGEFMRVALLKSVEADEPDIVARERLGLRAGDGL